MEFVRRRIENYLPVIRYGSDVELAKEIIVRVARENQSGYVTDSISRWKRVVDKYHIEDAQVEPTLAITLTDNWIRFNHLLHDLIGKEIEKGQ